jgi:hypothetical protein
VRVVNQAVLYFPLIIMQNVGTTNFIVGHHFPTFDNYMTFLNVDEGGGDRCYTFAYCNHISLAHITCSI